MQFFERDEFLLEALSCFISEALSRGDNVLILATRAHRLAVEQKLANAEVDLAACSEHGRFVALCAEELVERLVVQGELRPEMFQTHIVPWVEKLSAGGRRLSASGELVAILCERGMPEVAIQLEELWNEAGRRYTFELFCAYPISSFSSPAAAEHFRHICNAHARVFPAETYTSREDYHDANSRTIAALQRDSAALKAEISERKRAENALRRRESELTSLVQSAPVGLHWVGPDGVILWANKAEFQMLGYSAEQYIGRHISEFHVDQKVVPDMLDRLKRGEKLSNFEARLRCANGTIKTVLVDSSAYHEDGKFVHTQCFTRDVTEQKRSERSNALLAAIVESSDDAIVSKDLNGIITSWNKSAERIFGYKSDEVLGASITVLIPPDRLSEEPLILQRIRRGERVDHFETVRRRKDGTLIDISLTISPIRDANGQITGASKVARDITAHKRAEAALRCAREELARANQELEARVQERTHSLSEAVAQMEEFSYTVSHDLRAPLRAMAGFSQVLLEEFSDVLSDEGKHYVRRIADNAARLDRMVTDVLTYSRLSRGKIALENVRLDQLVRDLVGHYTAMQAPKAQVRVEPLDNVIGHEPSVSQAISNLLSNSLKFVAPGVIPNIRIWSERSAGRVRLWIQDNGIGVPAGLESRIFGMFERMHPDLPYDGTGVGLAIVRKAVSRMGGTVGYESDGTNGSRFWIELNAAS